MRMCAALRAYFKFENMSVTLGRSSCFALITRSDLDYFISACWILTFWANFSWYDNEDQKLECEQRKGSYVVCKYWRYQVRKHFSVLNSLTLTFRDTSNLTVILTLLQPRKINKLSLCVFLYCFTISVAILARISCVSTIWHCCVLLLVS